MKSDFDYRKARCNNCPFWEPANGVCFFPGDCDLPKEDPELLKMMREDFDEHTKEIRT